MENLLVKKKKKVEKTLIMKKKKNKFKSRVKKKTDERKETVCRRSEKFITSVKNVKLRSFTQPLLRHREGEKWYEYQVNEKINDPLNDTLGTADLLCLEEEADILLEADVDLYNKFVCTQGGSEAAWLQSVIKKGTASDRMTAMQLQLHNSPVHSLSYLELMITSVEKRNTREAMEILPLLEDIFLNHILPVNRKLVPFSGRPVRRLREICSNSEDGRRRLLILWRFEHRLKLVYERFLRALEGLAALMVEDLSKRALRTALNLLAERPEGEGFLLSMLVNKMGHPNSRIGAFVATLLEDLTKRQPNMRSVIVAEVERLIYRSNVSPRAHLYASTFLSQMTLCVDDSALAVRMLSIYFGLFKTLVNRKLSDSRLIGILLSAANRALPFAKEKADALTEEINTLYKIVHTSSYSVALQTIKLLYQVHKISDSLSERFYTALYRKLLVDVPPSCYNQLLLLLFKVLKSDPYEFRVRSFVKRLLQVATCATPSFAAGILILISRILETKKNLIVLQKDVDRIDVVSAKLKAEEIDDEERYVDIGVDGKPVTNIKEKVEYTDETCADVEEETQSYESSNINVVNKTGWIHRRSNSLKSPYDHAARNPLFVDCRNLVDSELLLLSKHYHPSVAVFAKALIESGRINYKGDPLEDFTLMKFLDRFAFKNPKEGRTKGSGNDRAVQKKHIDPWGVKKLPISSKEYLSKKTTELPADEHYLHRFASLKFIPQDQNKTKAEDEWEIESVDSAEFDAIIDKFGPGEGNDEFDVDYSKEFTAEKRKPKAVKRTAKDEDGDGDDVELELDDDVDGDDDNEHFDENEEYDDGIGELSEEDDNIDDIEMESESDGEESTSLKTSGKRDFYDSDDSDGDIDGNDAETAGEKFASLLEDFEEEDKAEARNKAKKKWKKSKALKRKRI